MSVTYEEMNKARNTYQESFREYKKTYYDFLVSVLEEVGFTDKLVQLKDRDLKGQFKIVEVDYVRQPFEIKFFPCRQSDGKISLKSKYINKLHSWNESTLVEQLKNIAEVVGDFP